MENALSVLVTLGFLFFKQFFVWMGYITNTATFPQPLTPQEEEIYLSLCKKGDEEAKNILIERNLRLVAHIVKKFASTGEDMDDLISVGTIGLIKAINTFNENRGSRLATYAARCIENEILMNLRASKKTKYPDFCSKTRQKKPPTTLIQRVLGFLFLSKSCSENHLFLTSPKIFLISPSFIYFLLKSISNSLPISLRTSL